MKLSLKLLILTLILGGCATSPTGRSQLMLVSSKEAIDGSREAYTQTIESLEKENKIISNTEVSDRVETITGRIIYQANQKYRHNPEWDWSIKVIDDPEMINAWCMAGGKMAIYTGLINKVDPTDDELAQVLAHEISHALANHTAERMSVAMATQLGVMGIGIATRNSDYGRAALTGSALAAMLAVQLPNSRASETEADIMGMELAAQAGFDPRAAATLWQKMEKAGGSGPAEFLSTHPSPGNRQHTLKMAAPEFMVLYLEAKTEDKTRDVYEFKD